MLDKLAEKHDLWIDLMMSLGIREDNARDIVQDMYIKIYDTKPNISYGKEDINTYYVYKVLKSVMIDKFRKTRNNDFLVFHDGISKQYEDYDYDRDDALFSLSDKMRDYLSTLPVFHQRVLELYFGFHPNKNNKTINPENFSQRRLSRETGVSLSTIHNTLSSLKKDLLELFKEDIEDYFNEDYDKI